MTTYNRVRKFDLLTEDLKAKLEETRALAKRLQSTLEQSRIKP